MMEYIGLNNEICKEPSYYCKSHKIYLSKEDVEKKKCLKKMDKDMIGYSTCNWLIPLHQYEQESIEMRDRLKKAKDIHKKMEIPADVKTKY